jgi:cyanate lyase
MARTLTTSEKILDQLAEGHSFSELSRQHGYNRQDFLTAALFGVAELQAEYAELLKKHGRFKDFDKNE